VHLRIERNGTVIALGLPGFNVMKAEDTKTPQSHRSDRLDAKEVTPGAKAEAPGFQVPPGHVLRRS
jgi:hypothetical protein